MDVTIVFCMVRVFVGEGVRVERFDGGGGGVAASGPSAVPVGATTRGVAERVRRVFRHLRERIAGPHTSAEGGVANGEFGSAPGSPAEAECRCVPEYPAGAAATARRPAPTTPAAAAPAVTHNSRLKACGKKLSIFIPKSGGTEDSVLTPGTERRLERLPAMLGASPSPRAASPASAAPPTTTVPAPAPSPVPPPPYLYDVYLGGTIPPSGPRPEERLRAAGLTYVVPRVNDYTRMFSAPARRAAAAHPDSPRTDKKPRPSFPSAPPPPPSPLPHDVQLRERDAAEPADRLSASDFYTVSDDLTPQPFKGTYDEELLWGSRALLFCISSQAPCFSAMVLAAHYMELRPAATVLLVQNLERVPNLSENAVKDYNRGRHYLADLARRSGVPVYNTTEEALACVLAKLGSAHRNSTCAP